MLKRGRLLKGVDRVSDDFTLKSHQVVLNSLDYTMIKKNVGVIFSSRSSLTARIAGSAIDTQ